MHDSFGHLEDYDVFQCSAQIASKTFTILCASESVVLKKKKIYIYI